MILARIVVTVGQQRTEQLAEIQQVVESPRKQHLSVVAAPALTGELGSDAGDFVEEANQLDNAFIALETEP